MRIWTPVSHFLTLYLGNRKNLRKKDAKEASSIDQMVRITYNFDPDRWYGNERVVLQKKRRCGALSGEMFGRVLADPDHRYEEMLDRLDGT